jgi:hypothetical protein
MCSAKLHGNEMFSLGRRNQRGSAREEKGRQKEGKKKASKQARKKERKRFVDFQQEQLCTYAIQWVFFSSIVNERPREAL